MVKIRVAGWEVAPGVWLMMLAVNEHGTCTRTHSL